MLRNSPLQASKVSPLEKQHDMAQRLTRCGGTLARSRYTCYEAERSIGFLGFWFFSSSGHLIQLLGFHLRPTRKLLV